MTPFTSLQHTIREKKIFLLFKIIFHLQEENTSIIHHSQGVCAASGQVLYQDKRESGLFPRRLPSTLIPKDWEWEEEKGSHPKQSCFALQLSKDPKDTQEGGKTFSSFWLL